MTQITINLNEFLALNDLLTAVKEARLGPHNFPGDHAYGINTIVGQIEKIRGETNV